MNYGRWTTIEVAAPAQQQEQPSVVRSWVGTGGDDWCTDSAALNPTFTYCYFKSLVLTEFSNDMYYYSFILYTSDYDGSSNNNNTTYSGFVTPNNNGFVLIDLLLHDDQDGNYVNFWFVWEAGTAGAFIVKDSNQNYYPDNNDDVAAEVSM